MQNKILYIYGDSNTYGYNPLASCYEDDRLPEENRWPVMLQKYLSSSIEVIADGLNGRCLPGNESERQRFIKTLERYDKLDFLAVMLGTNDVLNQSAPDPMLISKHLERLLESIKGARAELECIIITTPKMGFPEGHPMYEYRKANEKLRNLYREIAEKYNAGFIDAGSWDIDLFYDGIHLSESGNAEFAEHISEGLKQLII